MVGVRFICCCCLLAFVGDVLALLLAPPSGGKNPDDGDGELFSLRCLSALFVTAPSAIALMLLKFGGGVVPLGSAVRDGERPCGAALLRGDGADDADGETPPFPVVCVWFLGVTSSEPKGGGGGGWSAAASTGGGGGGSLVTSSGGGADKEEAAKAALLDPSGCSSS